MKRFVHSQKGLSLVELMVGITLGLILMGGVIQMFVSSKTVYSTQQNMSRIQETGRLAIEFLSRDIRSAGLYGCFRPNPLEPARALKDGDLVITGLHGNFGEFVRGYSNVNALNATQKTYLGGNVTANSNILVLRYASPLPRIITAPSTSTQLTVFSPQGITNGCVDGLCDENAAVVSDCFRARVFKVTNLAHSGNTLTIDHASWDADQTSAFSRGEVMPMNTVTYFIRTGPSGAPSLYQKVNLGQATEILEGVESVSYLFASNSDASYKTPQTVPNWLDVNSVQISVVVRSINNNAVPSPQSYIVNGVTTTPGASDRYMRQVFTATVGLRSPIAND